MVRHLPFLLRTALRTVAVVALLAVTHVTPAWSTISQYIFQSTTGSGTDMSGGTQVLSNTSYYYGLSGAIALPFSFSFNGTSYSYIFAHANGRAMLTNTSSSSYSYDYYYYRCPSYTYDGYLNVDRAELKVWDGYYGNYISGQGVRYKTLGTVGSRVFVLAWEARDNYGSGNTLKYELRLYEGSNNVEYFYETMPSGAQGHIGLAMAGASASYSTDYTIVNPSGPTLYSYSSYYGSSQCPFTSPGSGTLYRFIGCQQSISGNTVQGGTDAMSSGDLLMSGVTVQRGSSTTRQPFSLSQVGAFCGGSTTFTYTITPFPGYPAGEYSIPASTSTVPATPTITFTPKGVGVRRATLTINGGNGFTRTYTLAANGTPRLTITGNVAQGGTATMTNGDPLLSTKIVTRYGTGTFNPFIVANTGSTGPAVVTYSLAGSSNGQYAIAPTSTSLNIGQNTSPTITFTPTSDVGVIRDTLIIDADGQILRYPLAALSGGIGATFSLNGFSLTDPTNTELFRNVYGCVGEYVVLPITVNSYGTNPVTVSGMSTFLTDTTVRQGQPEYALLRDANDNFVRSIDYGLYAAMPSPGSIAISESNPLSIPGQTTTTLYLAFQPSRSGKLFARSLIYTDASNLSSPDPLYNEGNIAGMLSVAYYGRGQAAHLAGDARGTAMKPVNFGATSLHGSSTQWVRVMNPGQCNLYIDSAAFELVSGDVEEFHILGLPAGWVATGVNSNGKYTMVPGAIDSFQVSFTPHYTGSRRASILFRTNDSAFGTEAGSANNHGDFYLDMNGIGGTGVYGSNVVLDLGEIGNTTGPWSKGDVVLTNVSGGDASIVNVFWEGADSVDFKAMGWPTLPATLPPSGVLPLTVEFHPMGGTPGVRQATLVAVTSTGDFVRSTVSATAGARTLTANPGAVNFPTAKAGRVVRQTVVLQNTGTMPVTVSGVSISGANSADFQVAPMVRVDLAPGQSELIEVSFRRATAGASVASLDIASNVAGSPIQVALNATATVNRYTGDEDPDAAVIGDNSKDRPSDNGAELGVAGVAAQQVVSALTVLPNPVVGGDLEVNYRAVRGGVVRVEMVNATGAVVASVERNGVVAGAEQRERLDVAGLGSGMYLLRVVTAEGVAVRSVVISR